MVSMFKMALILAMVMRFLKGYKSLTARRIHPR